MGSFNEWFVPNANQLNRPDNLSDKPVISSSPKKHIDTSLEDMQSTSNTDRYNRNTSVCYRDWSEGAPVMLTLLLSYPVNQVTGCSGQC
jgi:hypothetical protein